MRNLGSLKSELITPQSDLLSAAGKRKHQQTEQRPHASVTVLFSGILGVQKVKINSFHVVIQTRSLLKTHAEVALI